ncbi:MAG: diaminopimelate decarboxylase [bacterium]|nr:diaminopimelate decarboxylase [bacterium]
MLEDPQRYGVCLEGDRLHVEGVALEAIAAEFGTPTYVYGADHIRRRYETLKDALSARPTTICYSVKANSSQAVLRHLTRLGAGADIVSGGELRRVLAAGMAPDRVVFSGVGKTDVEIDAALEAGVRSLNVESGEELDRIAARAVALGKTASVTLRINPDIDPNTHPYLATGLKNAKFGIPMEEGFDLALHAAGLESVDLVGVACHIGSQIVESSPFVDSFHRLRQLVEGLAGRGISLRQLNLGGGLGIAYSAHDSVLDPDAWGRALVEATAALDLELLIEPGRYLVGNAGVLLTRVLGCKINGPRRFVVVDAAMNDLLRPALYQAYHAIVPVQLDAEPATQVCDVVGPVCETGDFLALDREMPVVRRGDLLVVLSAGAYGMVMASNYNTRVLPAEVMVSGPRFAVTRRRQTLDELLGLEFVPDWLA